MKLSELLGLQIKKNPVGFAKTPYGKALTAGFNMVPSSYTTADYKLSDSKQPVRIVFTGMGDSQQNDRSRDIFISKYPEDTFIFGHKQLQDALDFATQIKDRPVIVYGHSWGSNAARLFTNKYKGNIQQLHFLDPMRKQMTDAPILQVEKDVPITYTPAGKYKDKPFIQALFDSLRWKPSKTMIIRERVPYHNSVQEWLNNLQAAKAVKQKAEQQGKIVIQKTSAVPVPVQFSAVSRRYLNSDQPVDIEWARKRKNRRILKAIARSQKREAGKGSFLSSWLRTLNAGIQQKARANADEFYRGQEYDYSKYKAPKALGNVVIAFAGATQGPGRGLDKYLAKRYGGQNYAIFRPADVGKAVKFARSLPEGTKIYVQGHSHGGAAAAQFAQSGIPIERMITYDPVSGVGKPVQKYPNVKKWYNAVAGDYDYTKDSNVFTWLPKKLGSDFADVFIRGAGKWGRIKGAVNVNVSKASHSDVQKMYRAIERRMAKGASITYTQAFQKMAQLKSLQEQNKQNTPMTYMQAHRRMQRSINDMLKPPEPDIAQAKTNNKLTVDAPEGSPSQTLGNVK